MQALLLVGLPASGKAAYAQKRGWHIVSRDEIRREIAGDALSLSEWSAKREVEVQRALSARLEEAAEAGYDTALVDAHLGENSRSEAVALLRSLGFGLEMVFMDVPPSLCMLRNRNRARRDRVPDTVWSKLSPLYFATKATLDLYCRENSIPLKAESITEKICGVCKKFDGVRDSSYGYCGALPNNGSIAMLQKRARLLYADQSCCF